MAEWPWQKKWLYYDSLHALNIQEQASMPDMDADTDISPGQTPSPGQMPAGGLTTGSGMGGSTKNVPPSVAQHETVIKNKNH